MVDPKLNAAPGAAPAAAGAHPPNEPPVPANINGLSGPEFRNFAFLVCLGMANAGFTNATAMTTLNSTVSHMTGTTTRIGWELSDSDSIDWVQVRSDLLTVFGYLFGVILAGAVVGPSGKFRVSWRYSVCFVLEAIVLYVCGAQGVTWQQPAQALKFLLSFAMGVQNGLTSLWSGGVGRSTHLTGFYADVGLIIAQILHSYANADWFRLRLFVPMVVSFFFGSLIGGAIHRVLYASALYFPATVALLYGVGSFVWVEYHNRIAAKNPTAVQLASLDAAAAAVPAPDPNAVPAAGGAAGDAVVATSGGDVSAVVGGDSAAGGGAASPAASSPKAAAIDHDNFV